MGNAEYQGYAQMEDAIFEFYDKLTENKGVGLFYFAGHGVQHDGESYLIPVDAKRLLKNIRHLRTKAMSATYILDTMKAAGTQVNLLILDACRNAPSFVRSWSSRGEMDMPLGLDYLMLKKVRRGVLNETDGKQSPGYYDELTEDFCFQSCR